MEQYKDFFFSPAGMTVSAAGEQSSLTRHEFEWDDGFKRKYETMLKAQLANIPNLTDEDQLLMNSFFDTVNKQSRLSREYRPLLNSAVAMDEVNYLELCGFGKSSRKFNIICDFSQTLDLILAFILNADYIELRERLNVLCDKVGITYRVLSRAMTTGEHMLVNKVPLDLFYEVSPRLKEHLQSALSNRRQLANTPFFSGLKLNRMNDRQFVQVVLQTHILYVLQYMLNSVLSSFATTKETRRLNSVASSKGMYNLVFQSEFSDIEFEPLIDLGSVGTIRVKPAVVHRGMYVKLLVQEERRIVIV